MKNNRWFRMIGWLLALVMLLTLSSAVSFAEETGMPSSNYFQTGGMLAEETKDISENTQVALTDASGKAVTVEAMDPNLLNRMKLTISGLDNILTIDETTKLAVSLPENIRIPESELVQFSNDDVTAELQDNELLLSWKEEIKDSLVLSFTVVPNIPAENDLSGSYVLGTRGNQYYKVMLGTGEFQDSKNKKRLRLTGYAFEEVDGKVFIFSEEDAYVWELNHVSGNYYTVCSNKNGKYLKIDEKNNGLILETATEDTAQKLLVESVGDGYYSFRYQNKSINNSSFNPKNGFASYDYETGTNAILKLYNPSNVIREPITDLSGTWVITNAKRENALTADKKSNGKLAAIDYTVEDGFLVTSDDITTFTFENIIRDWYTVKTDSGYLNISNNGAFISNNPQHLVVRTDKKYNSIILSNNELYDTGYTLKNMSGGYGTVLKHEYNDDTRLTLIPAGNIIKSNEESEAILKFDMNGGTGDTEPEIIRGDFGQEIVLPGLNCTKNGKAFIGWADVSDIYAVNKVGNHRYHDVYKPGDTYIMGPGRTTLYAIYNTTVSWVQFGIREDGVIQDEPQDHSASEYKGHIKIYENLLKETRWVIDIDSTNTVNDYYLENDVTRNLTRLPSAEDFVAALKNEGNIDFDPETQYIHFYVLKCTGVGQFKVDGVIRNKAKVEVTYNMNVPGAEKSQIDNMPGSYQVAPGAGILIGSGQDSTEINTPSRDGYVFKGWNSAADGSGIDYSAGSYVRLKNNLNLYAQWEKVTEGKRSIRLTSDWPAGKPAPAGTMITLTAQLKGFDDNLKYTLQWQYSTDLVNWIDATGETNSDMTYEMTEITATYTWRVIAIVEK